MRRFLITLLLSTLFGLTEHGAPAEAQSNRLAAARSELPEIGMGSHILEDIDISHLRRLNVRLVRTTLSWAMWEEEPAYRRSWDENFARTAAAGIEILLLVHLPPASANCTWETRELCYRNFARFTAQLAQRWPQLRYIELWNEQNVDFTPVFGAGRPNVSQRERGALYTAQLRLAYPAIRAANPRTQVVVGGVAGSPEEQTAFVEGIYAAGGRPFFDVMNIHTYGLPLLVNFRAGGEAVRRIMAAQGDGAKQLWNTEFGLSAGVIACAWGLPRSWTPAEPDGSGFDRIHLRELREVIEYNDAVRLYDKVLPYQLYAPEEPGHCADRLRGARVREIRDFGFGFVRADRTTPRPAYLWLAEYLRHR